MTNEFSSSRPIYLQLIDKFLLAIVRGQWAPGEKMPSVRQLALDFGVNPNTIQKSLAELEQMGYARSERTVGRYIIDDEEKIQALKQELALKEIDRFVDQMQTLSLDCEKACQLVERRWKERPKTERKVPDHVTN